MDCPKCGTYNPEDRTTCWRCDAELPKPKPVKKKDPQKNAQMWLYVIVAVFLVITLLQTCGVELPFGSRSPIEPTGHVPNNAIVAVLPDVAPLYPRTPPGKSRGKAQVPGL